MLSIPRKVVKNAFLTRHGTYNINSNRKIVKLQVNFLTKNRKIIVQ